MRSMTPEELAQWEAHKYGGDMDPILDICTTLARDNNRIIVTGIKDGSSFGDPKCHWTFCYLCQKPTQAYLENLGRVFKVYPNGKVVASMMGTDWRGKKVRMTELIRMGRD